jgi:hypothetical protein
MTNGWGYADKESDAEYFTKEELQRRMEEARESITQTVTEIKETVTDQYQSVRESITELDWREQFQRRPITWSIIALEIGFLAGYGLASILRRRD